MSDNFADALNTVKKMVDSGNIPSDIQGMINNLSGQKTSQNDLSKMLNQISPEMLANLSSSLNSGNNGNSNSTNNNSTNSNSANTSSDNSGFNIDINTMLKMKNIIESMNQKNDPRANLLQSLKPYLRDSKKDKLDQYVNLLNMTKIAELMKNDKKENKPND